MSQKDHELDPLVTIGIPNFNYGHYILETLESVVEQTYENIELIIVDDCSTDNSISVIEKWTADYRGKQRIKFIRNIINEGLSKVCNTILREANGKYFQVLDADDLILPDKVYKQVTLLERENAAMVYSNAFLIDKDGSTLTTDYLHRIHYSAPTMPSGKIFEDLLRFNFISLPSVLVNTSNARSVGGFNDKLQVQDYYLWLKLAQRYPITFINERLAKYRVHNLSMGENPSTNVKSEDSVLEIKYPYYQSSSREIKNIIKKNIQNSSVYLYEQGYPTAKKWLKVAFKLKPGVKTFLYYFFSLNNLSFKIIKKIKAQTGFQVNPK